MTPATDPIAALRPLHLPEPVNWWPPAPGWWLLAALLLAAAGGIWWLRRRTALRRAALAELRRLERLAGDDSRFSAEVGQLLRRVALARYPRERVAGLSGDAWLRFLDSECPGAGFQSGPGRALTTAPFAKASTLDRGALLALARRWIQGCRKRSA